MMTSPTYIKNVQDHDVRGGGAQLIGGLHPNLVGREEGEVPRDAAGVAVLGRAIADTLLLSARPPAHRSRGQEVRRSRTSLAVRMKRAMGGGSPQLVLESVSGLDVGLAPPTWSPPAGQVPGVEGPAG